MHACRANRWSKIKSHLQEDSPVEECLLLLSRGLDPSFIYIIIHKNKLNSAPCWIESESTEKDHSTDSGRSTMHAYMHEHASGRQLSKFDYRRLYLAYGRLHACRCSILGSQHYM